jgi:hypothetical protein
MSPSPLDPARAMKEAITSLEEQVKVRVTSVESGTWRSGSHDGSKGCGRFSNRRHGCADLKLVYPNEPPRILHRLGQFWSPPRGTKQREQNETNAGNREAAKGFRRLEAYKHLPVLRAALATHQSKYVTQRVEHDADAA